VGIRSIVVIAAIAMSWGITARAVEPTEPASGAEPQQSREQMARAHEKMAACLRSERPLAECRAEMMHTCKAAKAKQGCEMKMTDHGEHKAAAPDAAP
jgi:hypothetical protein